MSAQSLLQSSVLIWVAGIVLGLIGISLSMAVAAVYLRVRNETAEARIKELDAAWTPLILDAVGGELEPDALSGQIEAADARAFLDVLYRFARRLRGPEAKVLRELATPHLPTILDQLEAADPERRARIVQVVGEFGLPRHTDVMVRALDDASPLVAMVAARRLFRPGNEEYFPAVLQRLDRFTPWSPRMMAGLLRAGGAGAIPTLRTFYEDRERTQAERALAANALAMFPDPAAADPASRVLAESTAGRELKAASLHLLELVGHEEHRPIILAHLASPDDVVRQGAAEALGAVGRSEDQARLVQLIRDDSPWVSLAAARALKALGGQEQLRLHVQDGGSGSLAVRQVLEGG